MRDHVRVRAARRRDRLAAGRPGAVHQTAPRPAAPTLSISQIARSRDVGRRN